MNNMFFLPADPTDHVDAACAEAAARGAPVLLRVTAQRTANAAPGWPDDAPVFAWREAGLSLQAEGAVIDRRFIDFEEATSALADLRAQSVGNLRGPAPLAVFGAAFDAGRAPGPPWSDWPAGLLRVPARVRWSAGDGRVHEARHCLVAPGETPAAVRARLAALASWSETAARAAWPVSGAVDSLETRTAFCGRVTAAAEACRVGALAKVVLARAACVEAPADARFDAAATFAALAEAHPEAQVFGFSEGDRAFVGATPERLAHVEGDALRTHALAGTAPAWSGTALLESAKDRHEHQLVVEGMLARLGPLAESVEAAATPRLRRAERMVHLETPITARLRPGADLLAVVARLHPTPALGGAPREAALGWLRAHEPLCRGWYGGPVGFVDPQGFGRAAVAIRSTHLSPQTAWLFAGVGVVAESSPAAEWRETELKLGVAGERLRLCAEGA